MDLLPWHHTRLRLFALALLTGCALIPRVGGPPKAARSSVQTGHHTNTYTTVSR